MAYFEITGIVQRSNDPGKNDPTKDPNHDPTRIKHGGITDPERNDPTRIAPNSPPIPGTPDPRTPSPSPSPSPGQPTPLKYF
jgi:hypothetical protein